MTKSAFEKLDNSIASFELLKQESEKYWEQIELDACWGFQVQKGSKWKPGLTESEIDDFQKQLGLQFPESLKNYFRTMNGLDKPGINNNGGEGPIEFGTRFYSYPDDIEKIKSKLDWILEDNALPKDAITQSMAPAIFPYFGHRFLILDNEELVLSMYGRDIIFWADSLSKGIARDTFYQYASVITAKVNTNSLWNKKALDLEKFNRPKRISQQRPTNN
ncbi:SMI1/KNR4 family protein [Pinibacter aurantiacus]|uniref:SMI1/KNR4 family protein n=1 Tax=Pinibacter aurantiacus TaxID=2851599 RepID=A0A9E2S6H2_9BACT|nr:SMI1/KNR4 family protein [Pinibacter aurantiacus]MBV4356621.1 SMI1/KNR4 family protein [Pinibacter aurantiacus]